MRRHGIWMASLILFGSAFLNEQPARADFAHLTLQSQAGDPIGLGKNYDITYTPANTVPNFFGGFNQRLVNGSPAFLSFVFLMPGAPDNLATLDFATDQLNLPIGPGTYLNAQRATFATAGHPGLDVSFQHHGSNTLTGSFIITDFTFFTDSSNAIHVGTFSASFQQHSEAATGDLIGQFQYFAAAPSAVVPEPSSLTLLGLGLAGLGLFATRVLI